MDDGDGLDRMLSRTLGRKAGCLGWTVLPFAYVVAVVQYPDYWAIATGIIFVIASGLFTSKVILALENPWAAFGLAPIFGTGWILFLWLLFKLVG
jgi:hypothetical protein